MSTCSEQEYQFFDACEEIESTSGSECDTEHIFNLTSNYSFFGYQIWNKISISVEERRSRFLKWMGVDLSPNPRENSTEIQHHGDRDKEENGIGLRNLSLSNGRDGESPTHHPNDVKIFEMSGLGTSPSKHSASNVGDERDTSTRPSSLEQLMRKETEEDDDVDTPTRTKKGWFNRLYPIACVVDKNLQGKVPCGEEDQILGLSDWRIKVRHYGKQKKELSALYKGKDIKAHKGSILTMKFSPDGRFLASAGEDRILRVWKILVDERSNEFDNPEIDPSCTYFTVNHESKLRPLFIEKVVKNIKKTPDSACVVLPPKVLRIPEKPLHEFSGHGGDILDLSWSNKHHILSASLDKKVRLWEVGSDHCLGVCSHNNFVTCVHFNPVDDSFCMSGSVDGKVRIWEFPSCQVVGWTDTKDVVTAVCYRPDGQGCIVGTMAGECRFYTIADNQLQLDSHIRLHKKKKSPSRRITGFQFCPQDPNRVMVTSGGSKVQILQGHIITEKYRVPRKVANQTSASFSSDGKHILSACEDSRVYMWDCVPHEGGDRSHPKKVRSCERFSSRGSSIAVPWCGSKHSDVSGFCVLPASVGDPPIPVTMPSPTSFSMSQEYRVEPITKGCATWPEEKLEPNTPHQTKTLDRLRYEFLQSSCESARASHAWGMVIVTAGHDGRIRSFHNYGLPTHF